MSSLSDPDIIERMMSADPEEEFRQICMCIRLGDVNKASEVYRGVNVNQPLSIWDRRPPLHLAIGKVDTAMVRFLLQTCDADPNTTDDKGRTALHIAVLEGNTEIIQMLIEHGGIDFKAVDKWGQTALHLASLCANTSAAQLLLGHCMECLQYRQQDGITPLQIATMADNKQIAALFSAAAENSRERSSVVISELEASVADLPTPPSLHSFQVAHAPQSSSTSQANGVVNLPDTADTSEPPANDNRVVDKPGNREPESIATVEDIPLKCFTASTECSADSMVCCTSTAEPSKTLASMESNPNGAVEDVQSIPSDDFAKHETFSCDRSTTSLVFEQITWRSHSEQLLHHLEHHSLISELVSANLASCSSELQSKQEELATVRSLLAEVSESQSEQATPGFSVEEMVAILDSQRFEMSKLRTENDRMCASLRTTQDTMPNLRKQMDEMTLLLQHKESELEELRAECSTLKSTITCLKSQQTGSQNVNGILQETFKHLELDPPVQGSCHLYQHFGQTLPDENTSDRALHSSPVTDGFTDVDSNENSSRQMRAVLDVPSCFVLGSACDASGTWILDWNLTGFVVSSVIDDTTRSIQINFTNADSRPVADLTDHAGYNKASLGRFSVLLSSSRKNDYSPARIYYKSFDSSTAKSDWSGTLEDEDVTAICLVGRNAAICSDRGILRIMSQSGIHLAVLCLEHPVVNMTASSYNHLAALMRTSTGSYCYMLFKVDLQIRQLVSGAAPFSSNCPIIWSGFSEQGLYITLDSTLFLRGLASIRGSYQWVALLDASASFTTPRTKFWPLGASYSDLLVVTIQSDLAELPAACRPAPRRLPFKPPTISVDGQDATNEQRFLLSSVMIGHYQSQEAAGKRRRDDDLACARLVVEQDSALIELFHAAVNGNNISRALDLSTYLKSNLSSARSHHELSDQISSASE